MSDEKPKNLLEALDDLVEREKKLPKHLCRITVYNQDSGGSYSVPAWLGYRGDMVWCHIPGVSILAHSTYATQDYLDISSVVNAFSMTELRMALHQTMSPNAGKIWGWKRDPERDYDPPGMELTWNEKWAIINYMRLKQFFHPHHYKTREEKLKEMESDEDRIIPIVYSNLLRTGPGLFLYTERDGGGSEFLGGPTQEPGEVLRTLLIQFDDKMEHFQLSYRQGE